MPAIPETCPEPRFPLEGYALDEWWRTGPELHRLGLLTIVDLPVFAAYCDAVATWRTAREALAKVAEPKYRRSLHAIGAFGRNRRP